MKRMISAGMVVAGLVLVPTLVWAQRDREAASSKDGLAKSAALRSVTGPAEPMNRAISSGATAIITLQPVPPKTVPASNYPPGSSIIGQDLHLGAVPSRVWLEVTLTGWAPELLKLFQFTVDATDLDGDGGGYSGASADCAGDPMAGAGDLFAAVVECDGGTCHHDPSIRCVTNNDCNQGTDSRCNIGYCQGNSSILCGISSHCTSAGTTGPCITTIHDPCRAGLSGATSGCPVGEASRCVHRPPVFPSGGFACEFGFVDKCDPKWVGIGTFPTTAVDLSSLNTRGGIVFEVNAFVPDFEPSYVYTLVLDVPSDAKGTYHIDYDQNQTFLQNNRPPGENVIPIAEVRLPTISVACGSCCTDLTGASVCVDGLSEAECEVQPTIDSRHFREGVTCAEAVCCNCSTDTECDDGSVCTIDACNSECYCTHSPIAGFNPATECCHPESGVQAPIPASSPCRIGGCSLGGSSGSPTFTNVADGTGCSSIDPCYGDGQCQGGTCQSDEYPGADCPKVRFITFDGRLTPGSRALRIKFVSLHHPDPPYSGAPTSDFSAHEGEFRWVGPPASYVESEADPREVFASFTQCQPHYGDWFFYDLLHITGSVIVPSSIYQIQSIPSGLDINNEANYSAPVTISTSRWGDLVIPLSPPSTTVQPDVGDIAEIVDKFKNTSQPCTKPRALMVGSGMGSIPNLSGDITFSDISAVVDANRGLGYPYPWPAPCP